MQANEIRNRFKVYEPGPQADTIGKCHEAFAILAGQIDEACADGREKALAMTHLEESLHWTVKAILRERDRSGG